MRDKVKVRNMRTERKWGFLTELTMLAVLGTVAWLILPEHGPIGMRTMLMLDALYVCSSMFFMYVLEKYAVIVSGMWEKVVINVLASVYTLVIMLLLNLIFFSDGARAVYDCLIAVAGTVCITLEDVILEHFYSRWRRQPRLLIIDTDPKNFSRMKRIKYGVLKNYNSWYENVKSKTTEEFSRFVRDIFPKFDAVCVLNGLKDEEYHIAVNTAVMMNKDLFIVPEMIDVGKTNARIVCFDDILTLYMPKTEFSSFELFVKRAMDIVVSAVGLIITAIPMAVIAAAIKISSPGPVIYKQTRYTRDKREFDIYKFRTMIPDAEKFSGPKFAEKDDPRITSVGKILRSLRLDELPQLINVIKSDMSIVGPRPERPVFADRFETEIENYNDRFKVKAGLTSLSHVYGRYSTYIHDRTYYDLFYITHYSLWYDLKIMLLTTKTMFLKSAAEGEDDFKEKTTAETKREVANK